MKIKKMSPRRVTMWYLALWIPIIILGTFIGGELIENIAISYFGIGGVLAIMGVVNLLMEDVDEY